MHPRHRLDLGFGDLGYGLAATLLVRDADPYADALWRRAGVAGLVTLSVRSAWDLLLTTLDWPPGGEVLVSAITHPDMVALVAAHGLVAVPVDIDPDTLTPDLAVLAAAVTDRTRAVLVVELFGGRTDLAPVAALARRHDLLLVVDAAQAFTGTAALDQDLGDVWLYSFGLIKTATAVGGGLLVTRDDRLRRDLAAALADWPDQPRREYALRLLRALALLVVSRPGVYGAVLGGLHRFGRDPDTLVSASTRSFRPTAAGLPLAPLRRRPSAALVALLARRLRRFDPGRLRRRQALGERVAAALPASVAHPGGRMPTRTHWLFPVVVDDPPRLVAELRAVGLDASASTSNLTAVTVPDRPVPERAVGLMASVVYLPVHPELPARAVRALQTVLRRHAGASRMAPQRERP